MAALESIALLSYIIRRSAVAGTFFLSANQLGMPGASISDVSFSKTSL
jgi:hypothetical protein